ncbi:MarR family transcriptional regulator [Natrinema sp. LN54]|uniref:MarR family transcriptional regulator n=1 Tax=Natrinema sp. LN54 TaxID=3458705 RepID=UPI004035810F
MASQTHRHDTRLEPIPRDLESASAKLVYLYLEAADGATIDELGEILAMKKIDILSVLNSLSSAGYVEQAGSEYVVAN